MKMHELLSAPLKKRTKKKHKNRRLKKSVALARFFEMPGQASNNKMWNWKKKIIISLGIWFTEVSTYYYSDNSYMKWENCEQLLFLRSKFKQCNGIETVVCGI